MQAVDLDGDGILTLSDVWIMIAEFWPLSLLLSAKTKVSRMFLNI